MSEDFPYYTPAEFLRMRTVLEETRAEVASIYTALNRAGISHGGTLAGLEQGLDVVMRLRAEVERLRDVLLEHERKLVEIWGKEENPYAVAYGWVKPMRDAALAGAPSETRREHRRPDGTPCHYDAEDACNKCGWVLPDERRALAERVREACASLLEGPRSDGFDHKSADRVRALDLDPLLGEP